MFIFIIDTDANHRVNFAEMPSRLECGEDCLRSEAFWGALGVVLFACSGF